MSHAVIRVEGMSKRYCIGRRERYLTMRDVLANTLKAPLRLWRRPVEKYIWALRDVSLEIREGEVVGLIGRNGAGKTTLLKILARITRPTKGYAEVRGRVGSLLEVGTGFHPELTGRENVFLSGAILGMRKSEIERKFDEILAFADVDEFIDTPLKHFSTGMQMRLAFAVAAHLEPQILLVDEVLAVGDLEFQKKCLGKMDEVAHAGRTILFVSHQMNQIRRLCNRVTWVDGGRIRMDDSAGEVVSAYEAAQLDTETDNGEHRFLRWEIVGQGQTLRDSFREVTFQLQVRLAEPISRGHFGMAILNESNLTVIGWGFNDLNLSSGLQELALKVPLLPLRPGVYTIVCSLFNRGNNLTGGQLIDQWYATPPLVVDTAPLSHPEDRWAGILNIPADLQVAQAAASSRTLAGEG